MGHGSCESPTSNDIRWRTGMATPSGTLTHGLIQHWQTRAVCRVRSQTPGTQRRGTPALLRQVDNKIRTSDRHSGPTAQVHLHLGTETGAPREPKGQRYPFLRTSTTFSLNQESVLKTKHCIGAFQGVVTRPHTCVEGCRALGPTPDHDSDIQGAAQALIVNQCSEESHSSPGVTDLCNKGKLVQPQDFWSWGWS